MTSCDDIADQNQLVEEFPPPPNYYSLFSSENSFSDSVTLPVPPIPNFNPYSRAYNGVFAHLQENAVCFDQLKDYRAELKRQLKLMMECSMKMISYIDPAVGGDVSRNVIELRTAISDFHRLLKEYRYHEAREVLCEDMRKQLQEVHNVEEEFRSLLKNNQELIEKIGL